MLGPFPSAPLFLCRLLDLHSQQAQVMLSFNAFFHGSAVNSLFPSHPSDVTKAACDFRGNLLAGAAKYVCAQMDAMDMDNAPHAVRPRVSKRLKRLDPETFKDQQESFNAWINAVKRLELAKKLVRDNRVCVRPCEPQPPL